MEKLIERAKNKDEIDTGEIIERFYFLGNSLGETACEGEKSYHQFSWAKKKVLEKLRSFMADGNKFR